MNEQIKVSNCKIIYLPKFGDTNIGHLSFLESQNHIDFDIKRVYYIYNIGNPNQIRGPHAHKKTTQLFICLNGSAVFHIDDGKNKQEILLNEPHHGMLMGKHVWHSITNISEGTTILVVASEKYDKNDYLMSYDEFRNHLKNDQ